MAERYMAEHGWKKAQRRRAEPEHQRTFYWK